MTTERCPACGAAVTASAQWCTLCYADLRVPVASVPAPAVDAQAVLAAAPLQAPAPGAQPVELPPDPILDAPVIKAAPVAGQELSGWPCLGCGAKVPLADDACPHCGSRFLPADEMPSLALPGVGDLTRMERPQKIVVMVVVSTVVTALLIAVAFLAGSVL